MSAQKGWVGASGKEEKEEARMSCFLLALRPEPHFLLLLLFFWVLLTLKKPAPLLCWMGTLTTRTFLEISSQSKLPALLPQPLVPCAITSSQYQNLPSLQLSSHLPRRRSKTDHKVIRYCWSKATALPEG